MSAALPRLRAIALLALALAACAAFADGQYPSPDRWEPARLRRAIEDRYRVVPLNDGVALVPRREGRDVKSIEVRGDMIAINGTPVTGAEVRERLGADAGPILALSYLAPQARRELFEAAVSGAPPSPEPPPGEPEAQETPPPAARETPTASEPRRSRGSDARVHIGGSVHVGDSETVDGPVIVIGGSAIVDGEVRDDVVAVGGNVRLGPKAKVVGDVTSVGGTVDRDGQAEVGGTINEIGFGRLPHIRFGRFWWPATGFLAFGPSVELMGSLFRMAFFGILAFLVFLLARNPIARIHHAAAVEPWKAGLIGLLTELLFVPVFILCCLILLVSIVGIPLLAILAPLAIVALFAAFVFGFAGVASSVGEWAQRRFGWGGQSPFALLLVGLLAIWALTIVGRIIALGGWPIWFVSAALLVAGFLVEYVAWTVGLGAAVMTRFGSRPGGAGPFPPVAPVAPAASQGPTA